MEVAGLESLAFCSRQISKACATALNHSDLPVVLRDASIVIRYDCRRDLHVAMSHILRRPEKVWDVLIASATAIRQETNLKRAVLKSFQMSAPSRTTFKTMLKPIIFVAIYLKEECDYFWFDQPTGMTIHDWVQTAQTFPQELADNTALMGSVLLDGLFNHTPDKMYVKIDMTPERVVSWTKLWKQKVGDGLSRTCIREMAAAMRRIPIIESEMISMRLAAKNPPKGSYLFQTNFCQRNYLWAVPPSAVDDTSSPDLVDTTVMQGKNNAIPRCCTV